MDWRSVDWKAVDRLRRLFLSQPPPHRPYWQSRAELETYDLTFAQRIGWKWDAVLRELALRGWQPPARTLLDWGCGTGIAARRLLEVFGPNRFDLVRFHDHSPLATQTAVELTRSAFSQLRVEPATSSWLASREPIGILLLSHVLSELIDATVQTLLRLADRAQSVLWVEPGTHVDSRRLGALRDRLRYRFTIVAPCTHQGPCGMFAPHNARHWCHFFAEPPPGLLADPDWAQFAQRAGVDLRSLPYSFVVLDRRPSSSGCQAPLAPAPRRSSPARPAQPQGLLSPQAAQPEGGSAYSRVIGRPRFYKALAKIFSCQQDGVYELILRERTAPELFSDIQNRPEGLIYQWVRAGDEIQAGQRIRPTEAGAGRSQSGQ